MPVGYSRRNVFVSEVHLNRNKKDDGQQKCEDCGVVSGEEFFHVIGSINGASGGWNVFPFLDESKVLQSIRSLQTIGKVFYNNCVNK